MIASCIFEITGVCNKKGELFFLFLEELLHTDPVEFVIKDRELREYFLFGSLFDEIAQFSPFFFRVDLCAVVPGLHFVVSDWDCS